MRFEATKDISILKIEASNRIDDAAGAKRQQYITNIPGQTDVYITKANQAEAYKVAGYPDPTGLSQYSYIIAEAKAQYGDTPTLTQYQVAADTIIAQYNTWTIVSPQIEFERRKAKIAINAATVASAIYSAEQDFNNALVSL